jgi:type IV secretion system protein VirD4
LATRKAANGHTIAPVKGGSTMEAFVLLLLIVGGFWLFLRAKRASAREASKSATIERTLAAFGTDTASREAGINKAFDEKTGAIDFYLDYHGNGAFQVIQCHMTRTVATMPARDREALRSMLLLRLHNLHVSDQNTWSQLLGVIYGDGKATIFGGWRYTWPENTGGAAVDRRIEAGVARLLGRDGLEPSVNCAIRELGYAVQKAPDHPAVRMLAARLLGTGGDMAPSGALRPIGDLSGVGSALIIGEDEKEMGRLWAFDGEGALITVAPPGSGKTQCHVLPNLLTWTGPAVVLDIKGEIYAATSAWRRANVGPVYRFSPLDPDAGHAYNPLLQVSEETDEIWEESRFLADMLIVPGGGNENPFWQQSARDVVTAAVAHTVYRMPPDQRHMGKVLDILHGIDWEAFLNSLTTATDVQSMVRMGKSLGGMERTTRNGVLQTALSNLGAWEGPRIARATATSDWQPLDLKSAENPTVYICMKLNEVDSYASVLRVIIAQHVRALASTDPGEKGATILFVLDEMPRLRNMPPIEEALEMGRGYGIKLWMFAQSIGQIETAYENAKGMIANCALRLFLNPSLADGTAQKISEDMGFRESVIDGTRVKRVEPEVLAGASFADRVIVMQSRGAPAQLRKHFAYSNPELMRRAGLAAGGTTPAANHVE